MTTPIEAALAASGQRARHLVDDDLSAMAGWLDDALVYVHSTGQVHDKPQLMRFFAHELRVLSLDRTPPRAIGGADLVVLSFEQRLRGQPIRMPGQTIQADAHVSEVWGRTHDDAWRLLHAQSTALRAVQPAPD